MLVQHLNSCSIAFKYGPDLPQNVEIALLTFNHKQNKTICVSVCCWCFGERPHTLLFEFYNLMRRSSTFFFFFLFKAALLLWILVKIYCLSIGSNGNQPTESQFSMFFSVKRTFLYA